MHYCGVRIHSLQFSPGPRLQSSDPLGLPEERGGSVWYLHSLDVCVGGDLGLLWSGINLGGPALLFNTGAAIAVLQKGNSVSRWKFYSQVQQSQYLSPNYLV